MASFISLYNETTTSIFDCKTKIQVRATQDKKEVFDSFNMEKIYTEAYVVIYFDEHVSPNYQIPIQTDISEAPHLDEAYCYQCNDRKVDAIQCKVWFRSKRSREHRTLCSECADKLMKCKEHGLDHVSTAEIAEKTI